MRHSCVDEDSGLRILGCSACSDDHSVYKYLTLEVITLDVFIVVVVFVIMINACMILVVLTIEFAFTAVVW